MIPDYQTLMRPVLARAAAGETRIGDAVEQIAEKLGLTPDERAQLLPSGKQIMFAIRAHLHYDPSCELRAWCAMCPGDSSRLLVLERFKCAKVDS